MSYITIKELAAEVGCNYGTLRQFARDFPNILYKKEEKLKTKKGVEYSRFIWIIDADKISLFKDLWETRHKSFISDGWTRTARECYEARLICRRCVNYKVCESVKKIVGYLPMKNKVIELYRAYGKPRKDI